MKRKTIVAALAATIALGACPRKESQDEGWAREAVDSTDVAQSEAAILVAGVEGADMNMSAEQVAVNAQTKATTLYQPAGCVTATAAGATVTYQLDDCTGPFGLVHVTGTVTVTYAITLGGITATATATGLDVNGGTMNINSSALYSVSGTTQSLTVTTAGDGVGPRGVGYTRAGDYTLTWDNASGCAGLDGTWSTTAFGRTWSTDVGAFEKCGSRCPAAGGSISYTGGLSGVTVTVEFDGGVTADWSTSRGKSGTIGLFCLP